MEELAIEDVNTLSFGKEFDGVQFMSNATAAIYLQDLANKKYTGDNRPPEAFAAALEYAQTFGGVVAGASPAAVDDLIFNLRNVQFDHEDGAGGITKVALHEYEVVALCNLNPAGTAAAKALLPSLERFAEDEVGEILTLLRKAHTRAGVAAALGGGAGGALA